MEPFGDRYKLNQLELEHQALRTKPKIDIENKKANLFRKILSLLGFSVSSINKFIEQVLEYTKKKL